MEKCGVVAAREGNYLPEAESIGFKDSMGVNRIFISNQPTG